MRLSALLLVLGCGVTHAVEPVPVAAFVKPVQYESAKISPTGDYLAVALPTAGQTMLGIIDLESMKISATLRFSDGEHVDEYWWVSPKRVVVSIATRWGLLDQPAATGELYGIDADGRNKQYLFGYRGASSTGTHLAGAKAQYAWAQMADTLPADDVNVLVSVTHWRATEQSDSVFHRLNVLTGALTRVTQVPIPVGAAFVADRLGQPRFAVGRNLKDEVVQMLPDGKQWRRVLEQPAVSDVKLLRMSPDDASIYLISDQGSPRRCLRELVLASSELRTLACIEDADVESVVFALDGSRPIAVYGGGRGMTAVQPEHADLKLLRGLAKGFPGQDLDIESQTVDGRRIVVKAVSDRLPGDFFLLDRDTKKAQFLFAQRPDIDPERMLPRRAVDYVTRDGTAIHGYLTAPPVTGGAKLPLVLLPHGGPFGERDEWAWDPWAQLLATRGYAVLQVNFRGSGGYGIAHERAGYRRMGTLMLDDLVDATRWAIEQGIADPARTCVVGASYGGYAAVMSAIREPGLYRCAASFAGVYDLVSLKSEGDTARSKLGTNLMDERWGEDEKELAAQSPVGQLAALQVPLLIAHGTLDERVPFSQARALRKALDAQDKAYEWLEFPGEQHGFQKPENHELFLNRLLAFLDKHTAAAPPPQ